MIYCFDLNGTLDRWPLELGPIVKALHLYGEEIHILTGHPGHRVTPDVVEYKRRQLEDLGLGSSYDKLVVVAGPNNIVYPEKVKYMKQVGASLLMDNDSANIKAAQAAGFATLKVGKKGEKHL